MSAYTPIKIGEKSVGLDHPCFVIAEAGVNHDGSIEKAKKLIDVAVEAKADAVKFQTFKTDKILIKSLKKCRYQKVGDGEEGSYADMIRRLELNEEMHRELFDYANQKGIMFLSTPFDNESTDMLDRLGVNAFKIDSGNLNHPQHLKYIASKGKPIILSTGMATISEIDEAVKAIYSEGNQQLILLHCTSNYPPHPSDVNLRAMKTLQYQFDVPVGYSDHTIGLPVTLAAAARGAVMVEKHFTLSRMAKGPDHLASLEPNELKQLVEGIKIIGQALGSTKKEPVAAEKEVADNLRRSIVSLNSIPQGIKITKDMLAVKRPGTGIPSKYLDLIVGRIAKQDIPEDSLINWDQI
ncbi:N-acetylneuraminate synthase [Candidatus Woesearchaeota archaeon]|nr:N-acetylneuraminate synthase [Candidatus Woesearchaeota archaeon]